MAKTEAEIRANKKYLKKFEVIQIRIPKGDRDSINAHADKMGESVNKFIQRAIREAMERDSI